MSFDTDKFELKSYIFDKKYLSELNTNYYLFNNYPVVYILYDPSSRLAYVGESINGVGRVLNHSANDKKNHLKYVLIISSSLFNKSAALDIESNLIKYISADNNFKLLRNL